MSLWRHSKLCPWPIIDPLLTLHRITTSCPSIPTTSNRKPESLVDYQGESQDCVASVHQETLTLWTALLPALNYKINSCETYVCSYCFYFFSFFTPVEVESQYEFLQIINHCCNFKQLDVVESRRGGARNQSHVWDGHLLAEWYLEF